MDVSLSLIRNSRHSYIKILENFSLEQLNTIPSGYQNSIIWNVAHVIATFDILVYKLSSLPSRMDADFIARYQKGTAHQQNLTEEEFSSLKTILLSQIDQFEEDVQSEIFKEFLEYKTSFGNTLTSVVDSLHFDLIHEGIHFGYILSLKKHVL